jgi:hypothetical protein
MTNQEATFTNHLDQAPFFCAHQASRAHYLTTEWGRGALDGGASVRVLIRAVDDRQYAHYLIPAAGLETMTGDEWAPWLESRGLAHLYAAPVLAARSYWDVPLRQLTWEVSLRLQAGDEVEASCQLSTERFWPVMAWRGVAAGEVIRHVDATVESQDIVGTRLGQIEWSGRGDEILIRLVDLLLSLRGDEAKQVELKALVDAAEPEKGLGISIRSDAGDEWPTWEIRHLLAHLYEWAEHCQGVAWHWVLVEVRRTGERIDLEMEVGYDPQRAPGREELG